MSWVLDNHLKDFESVQCISDLHFMDIFPGLTRLDMITLHHGEDSHAMPRFQAAIAWSAMVLDLSGGGAGDPSIVWLARYEPPKTSDWWLLTYYE